jgi:hypothetical protein
VFTVRYQERRGFAHAGMLTPRVLLLRRRGDAANLLVT